MNRSYSELIILKDYTSRLEYLKLLDNNALSPREHSSDFFKSQLWKETRKQIIRRDRRFDLGVFGIYIEGAVYVHHINPITKEDIDLMSYKLIDPENLVCTSLDTHNAIHYKKEMDLYIERTPGDTTPWIRR